MANLEELKNISIEFMNNMLKKRDEIIRLQAEIAKLMQKRNTLLKESKDILATVKQYSNLSKEEYAEKFFSEVPILLLTSDMQIGDAMEVIIKTQGAQFQKDIIAKIRSTGIRLSEKAPYVVIGNIVRHDKQKRFKILKDGRVGLTREK